MQEKAFTQAQKPLGIMRSMMMIGLLIILASVFYYIWAIKYAPQHTGEYFNIYDAGRQRFVVWPALEEEKRLYAAFGYDIGWMSGPAMQKIREMFGHWSIMLEIFALRFYGLFLTLPVLLTIALLGCVEGYMGYIERMALFQNISSTRFRVGTFCVAFLFTLVFLFVCLPFGSELPGIGTPIPLTINFASLDLWLTAPHIWAVLLAPLFFGVAQSITANLSRNI